MKYLVAIDDSPFSEAAIRMLVQQGRPKESEVKLLHVIEPVPISAEGMLWGFPVDPAAILKGQKEAGERLLARAADILRSAGWKVSGTVEEGDPQIRIIDGAAEWKADVIVLGSHGRKGLQRFLLGSVSDGVARHAHCSVEIVRNPAR